MEPFKRLQRQQDNQRQQNLAQPKSPLSNPPRLNRFKRLKNQQLANVSSKRNKAHVNQLVINVT